MKELLDEDAFDPKKLFDKKEYNTLLIGRDGFTENQNGIADLLESLFEQNLSREKSEAIFKLLKEANAGNMLVQTIKDCENEEQKAILTAACWESGLDFSKQFLFFVDLACSNHFQLALEALTVVEYNETVPDDAVINDALALVKSKSSLQSELQRKLLEHLQALLE